MLCIQDWADEPREWEGYPTQGDVDGGRGAEYLMKGDEILESIEGHTSLKRGQAVGGQLKSNGSMASGCSS